MIFVLSPAKALDYESPLSTPRFSEPDYLDDAACLIEGLRELSPAEVARLMDLSDSLAALNVATPNGRSLSRRIMPVPPCSLSMVMSMMVSMRGLFPRPIWNTPRGICAFCQACMDYSDPSI